MDSFARLGIRRTSEFLRLAAQWQYHSDGLTYHSSVMGLDIQAASGANQYRDHRHSVGVSAALALAGGYLDGFTFVGHGRIFANAMTGNIVYLGMEVLSSPARPNFRHLPPLFMFMLGIWAARALHLPRFRWIVRHPYVAVLLAEVIILFILAFLPNRTPDFWITAPITFAASMQVLTFRTVGPHTYTSTFTTGNLSTLSTGLFDWLFTTDKETARSKSRIFAIICGSFLVGATTGSLAVARWGNRALMPEVILLSLIAIRVKDV
jgi:uncharacterized membrane protein YoaK (UPF0700 family)